MFCYSGTGTKVKKSLPGSRRPFAFGTHGRFWAKGEYAQLPTKIFNFNLLANVRHPEILALPLQQVVAWARFSTSCTGSEREGVCLPLVKFVTNLPRRGKLGWMTHGPV